MYIELGQVAAAAREAATLTQKQLAERMGAHQSRISRMEQGDGDLEDFVRYLTTLETDRARELLELVQIEWKHLPRPSLQHPDIRTLADVEIALERLDGFRNQAPRVLSGQADLLYRRLYESGEYLIRLDHKVVYAGEIGVGKTTAACRQSGLVLDPETARDLRGMLLDTGGGRTTLCDVLVRVGTQFALEVEPLPDEEVYRLVAELARGVQEKQRGEAGSTASDFKPAEEVERALRNMAKLPRPVRRRVRPGEPPAPQAKDPAEELFASTGSPDEFRAEFAARLALWRRTRREIEFEGVDAAAGRQWLRETFTLINNGRHADFTLPERILVTVPFQPLGETPFEITLADTRGVDGSAIRGDLVRQLKDRRALSVLCCTWGAAPDPSLQELVKHVVDTDVDPTLLNRVIFLVLARAGDGLSMRYDDGQAVDDPDEGYEIKQGHVADALQRINIAGVEVRVFDAANDDPGALSDYFAGRISALRHSEAQAARQTISAIDQLLANVEEAKSLETLKAVNHELELYAERRQVLPAAHRGVHQGLLNAVRGAHARTVWAATRRAGSFWNFNVYERLGDSAAAEAKRRCAGAVDGLREILAQRLADPSFESAHSFIGELLNDVSAWEADFVRAARHHAVSVIRPQLSAADEVWGPCDEKYGQGYAYRDEVAGALETWFDAHGALLDDIESRVQRAWATSVLAPLKAAAGLDQAEAE
jgi:transcriptional regulator with XRE-family HTH domain